MSIELVKEVLERSPDGLDSTARLLLVVLAEKSQDRDRKDDRGRTIPARTCWPSQSDLMQLTGIKSAKGLEVAFERLRKFGLDPRISLGSDKNGRPIFAHRGRASSFRVPVMNGTPSPADEKGRTTVRAIDEEGRTTVRSLDEKGRTVVSASDEKGRTTVPKRANPSPRKGESRFAPNHKEPEVALPPTPQPKRNLVHAAARGREGEKALILQDLATAGLDVDEAQAVLEYAIHDEDTKLSKRGRLKQPGYLTHCREAVKTQRRNAFEAGPKCENHPWAVATNCGPCAADEMSEAPDTLPLDDLVHQAVEDFRLENPGLSARELAKRAAEIYQEMKKGRAA